MVSLGLLSYSLYLWHYPIFAFGRMAEPLPSIELKCVWIVITLVLSTLSYHLIEKPFRSRSVSRRMLFATVFLTSLALLAVSSLWIIAKGFPGRGGYLGGLVQSAEQRNVFLDGKNCHSGKFAGRFFGISESCVFTYSPGSKTLVLVGDSHAFSLAESVRALAEANGLNYSQVTQDGCPHIAGYPQALCGKRSKAVESFLRQFENPIIIYSARLQRLLEGGEFDNQEGEQGSDPDKTNSTTTINEKFERARGIVTTLTGWLDQGARLVIVYPVPEQGFHVNTRLFSYNQVIRNADEVPTLSTSYSLFKDRVASSYQALDQVTGPNVKRVYPEYLFCSAESDRCVASESDRLYFFSDNHVSPLGADLIIREVAVELGLRIPDSFRK